MIFCFAVGRKWNRCCEHASRRLGRWLEGEVGQAFLLNSTPWFLCVWFVVVQLILSLGESISTLEQSKKEGKYFMVVSSPYKIEVWQFLPEQFSLLKYCSSPVCTVVGWTVSKARDILQDGMSRYCLQGVVLACDDVHLQVLKCLFLGADCLMTESSRMVTVPW